MKLRSIYINRNNWDKEAKLTGKIEFDNVQATVSMTLSEEQAAKIVNLVAEDSLRYAKELSDVLVESVQAKLEAPGNPLQTTDGQPVTLNPEVSYLGSFHVPKVVSNTEDELPF